MALLISMSCNEKTPSRDNIPILKKRIYTLQEAIKNKNRAAIDSLLSPNILKYEQNSDSLLSLCYGPDGSFAFDRLGDCEIMYTDDRAFADCFIMDSTGQKDQPVHLRFVHQHNLWLLERFLISEDSVTADQ
jgi:hypothetical protein